MIRVKINQPNDSEIFLKALKENKVIAYPTDTIYGVGTAVTNDKGIDKINEMKKRQQPMSIALGLALGSDLIFESAFTDILLSLIHI